MNLLTDSETLQAVRAICIEARTSLDAEGPLPDGEALDRIVDLLFDESVWRNLGRTDKQ